MILVNINATNLHDMIKLIHVFISVTFLFVAIVLFTRSISGIINGKPYTIIDKYLAFVFIVMLYVQLILGFLLFTSFGPFAGYDFLGGDSSVRVASNRLWPIQHIVLMFFALLIATLGLILSGKTNLAKEKHKKVVYYYLISIVIIAQSLCVIYLF